MTDLGNRGPTRATRVYFDRWTQVKARLRAELGEKVFCSWFGRMELDCIHDATVHLTVPTKFLKGWIQACYADQLLACWKIELEPVARSAVLRNMSTGPRSARTFESVHKVRTCAMARVNDKVSGPVTKIKHKTVQASPLNPQLTFGAFTIGEPNTLAHAAAKQVAASLRGEAVVFHQLYIHARVGVGKTHLLQPIAWVGNQIPGPRVLYLTAEKLMHEFPSAGFYGYFVGYFVARAVCPGVWGLAWPVDDGAVCLFGAVSRGPVERRLVALTDGCERSTCATINAMRAQRRPRRDWRPCNVAAEDAMSTPLVARDGHA